MTFCIQTLLGKIQDGGFIRAFLFSFWTPVTSQSMHSRSNISMDHTQCADCFLYYVKHTSYGLSSLITHSCVEIIFILFRIFTCWKLQQFPDCANASISLLIFSKQNNLATPDEVQKSS